MPLATVAVTEKGSLNMHMTISSPGGHSSVPPPHTSVGILAKIITVLEETPFPAAIEEASSASIRHLQCLRDAPKMPARLREALQKLEWAERTMEPSVSLYARLPLLRRWYETILPQKARAQRLAKARMAVLHALSPKALTLFQTTQAADLFYGGIKVNALPERAEAFVNHRIAPHSSIQETIQHYVRVLQPLAQHYRFALTVFGDVIVPESDDTYAHVVLQDSSFTIDTAPPTPFEGPDAAAFELVSSVIRGTFYLDEPRHQLRGSLDPEDAPASHVYKDSIRVTPTTLPANTDTAWYHVRIFLTHPELDEKHSAFRAAVCSSRLDRHVCQPPNPYVFPTYKDTVNEHATIDGLVKSIEFYTHLIVAMDQSPIERVT